MGGVLCSGSLQVLPHIHRSGALKRLKPVKLSVNFTDLNWLYFKALK